MGTWALLRYASSGVIVGPSSIARHKLDADRVAREDS